MSKSSCHIEAGCRVLYQRDPTPGAAPVRALVVRALAGVADLMDDDGYRFHENIPFSELEPIGEGRPRPTPGAEETTGRPEEVDPPRPTEAAPTARVRLAGGRRAARP